MQTPVYQGDYLRTFIAKVKNFYTQYGFSSRPTNEDIAERLGVKPMQLNRYYKSANLQRETVQKILKAFNVEEKDIWTGVSDIRHLIYETTDDFHKLFNEPNLYIVPFKSYAGFLRGYGDGLGTDNNIEKIYYPLIKGEAYAFQVGGQSAFPEFPESTWFCGKPIAGPEDLVKGRIYTWQTVDGIVTKIFDKMDDEYFYISSVNDDFNPVKPLHRKDVKVIYRKVGKLDNIEN